jgi:hypothetical protein
MQEAEQHMSQMVYKNTGDIQALAQQVTRIATLVERNEKQRSEDVHTIQQAVTSINTLNHKIEQTMHISREVAEIKINIVKLQEHVSTIQSVIDKSSGGLQVIGFVWASLGAIIMAAVQYMLK